MVAEDICQCTVLSVLARRVARWRAGSPVACERPGVEWPKPPRQSFHIGPEGSHPSGRGVIPGQCPGQSSGFADDETQCMRAASCVIRASPPGDSALLSQQRFLTGAYQELSVQLVKGNATMMRSAVNFFG